MTLSASDIPALPAAGIPEATSGADGYLSSVDWTAFNGKQAALGYTPINKNGDSVLGTLIMNAQNELRFGDSGSNYVGLKAPATVTSSISWTLPPQDGGAGQFLATNGSGTLSWSSQSAAPVTSVAGSTLDGYLSSADWSTFNSKQNALLAAGSLAKVLAVRGISYKWIDGEKYGDKTQIGVIAQEIEKIVPEVVDTGNDGIKRVKYSDLVPLVIEAMKELKAANDAEIDRLKAENKDIKAKAAAIEAENKDIKAKAQSTEIKLNLLLKSLCEKDQSASFCH